MTEKVKEKAKLLKNKKNKKENDDKDDDDEDDKGEKKNYVVDLNDKNFDEMVF